MSIFETVMYGMLGGASAEILAYWKVRHSGCPEYFKSPFFWLMTIVMIIFGGGLVYIYHVTGAVFTPFVAINIGATAPIILGKMTSNEAEVSR